MSSFHFCLSVAKNRSSFQLLPASLVTNLLQLSVNIFVIPYTTDNVKRQIQEEFSMIMMDNTLTGIVESLLVHIEMKGSCQLHSVPNAKCTKLK
jgi:hypothetical protein